MAALTIIGFYLQGKKDKRIALEQTAGERCDVVNFPQRNTSAEMAYQLLDEYHNISELDPSLRIEETQKWQQKAKAWKHQSQQQAVR